MLQIENMSTADCNEEQTFFCIVQAKHVAETFFCLRFREIYHRTIRKIWSNERSVLTFMGRSSFPNYPRSADMKHFDSCRLCADHRNFKYPRYVGGTSNKRLAISPSPLCKYFEVSCYCQLFPMLSKSFESCIETFKEIDVNCRRWILVHQIVDEARRFEADNWGFKRGGNIRQWVEETGTHICAKQQFSRKLSRKLEIYCFNVSFA